MTPYLTIAAAYTLSAIGAHSSAMDTLLQWLTKHREVGEKITNRLSTRSYFSEAEKADFLSMQWFNLQVSVETLILAANSQKSGESIQLRPEAIRIFIDKIFVPILIDLGESSDLDQWRQTNQRRSCSTPAYTWRQALVASYASFIEEYLTLLNQTLSMPSEITRADIDLAKRITNLDASCFTRLGRLDELKLNQVSRNLTATAVRLNELFDHEHLMRSERVKLVEELDPILRIAAEETGPSQATCSPNPSAPPTAQFSCALSSSGSRRSDLNRAAQALLSLLTELRKDLY